VLAKTLSKGQLIERACFDHWDQFWSNNQMVNVLAVSTAVALGFFADADPACPCFGNLTPKVVALYFQTRPLFPGLLSAITKIIQGNYD